jgi:ubiquinol-cytochrome c reductase cytochrome c1 subunit
MNIGNKFFRAAAVAGLAVLGGTTMALAAGDAERPEAQDWQFSGPFGSFDIAAIQRGLQVYLEVCSACHSLNQVAYRNLIEVGFNADEIKAIAEQYEVTDGPDDNGDMFQRAARPSDTFVAPFANANAARASNNGALPTDLSLLAKAHPRGANYIFAILTGYKDPPDDVELGDGTQIAMAEPLFEDAVEYSDGTQATVENMAWDVSNFLQWAAEPEMEQRKRIGVGKWCCSCWC